MKLKVNQLNIGLMRKLVIVTFALLSINSFSQQADSISVLSWNVFLRPSILSDGQMKRVDSIANYLLSSNADVLVLQELFHKRSRRRLIKRLKSTYPYHTSMGRRSFFGVPSGVCIFSRDSIQLEGEISYTGGTGSDKLARKGALMVRIHHLKKRFSIFGTHLQAGGGETGKIIRKEQISELGSFVDAYCDSSTSIIAGDFNITQKVSNYSHVLDCLNAENFNPAGKIQSTANFTDHTLTNSSGKSKWIDFIFLHKKNAVKFRSSRIEEPRCNFKKKNQRMSDHNPIITVFQW